MRAAEIGNFHFAFVPVLGIHYYDALADPHGCAQHHQPAVSADGDREGLFAKGRLIIFRITNDEREVYQDSFTSPLSCLRQIATPA